jgi:hypothetical protein
MRTLLLITQQGSDHAMAATTPVEQQSFARRTLSVRRAARFAYAAGAAGMLGRLLLLALYALLAAGSADQYSVGAANDLVGTLESACMIPVALALAGRLPDRQAARVVQVAGLSAMAANAIAAPLMVVGVLSFSVATLIAAVAIQVLAAWLFLVNRWLRRSPDWWLPVARLGQLLGGAVLCGAAVVAFGLLLPWGSWPQLPVFGVGALPGFVAYLAIPVWFLILGRHLAQSPQAQR